MSERSSWQRDSQGKGLKTEVCLAHSRRGREARVARTERGQNGRRMEQMKGLSIGGFVRLLSGF